MLWLHGTGIERTVELARAVVRHRAKHGGACIDVAGERQVFLDKALRHRMHGHESDLAALAFENASRPDGSACP
jgi:hypothetical protein